MEYQHGGDIYSQEIQLDYSANINPLGMPEGVRDELKRCLDSDTCSVYPDSRCMRLKTALGRHHSLPEQWVICGNGAADLIFGMASALRPRHGLVMSPSFSEYEQALETVESRVDHFTLREEDGFVPDLREMCRHIQTMFRSGDGYDIVFFCNPNNPTGIPAERELVELLASTCDAAEAVLVVDECFCDFLDGPELYSVIPCLSRYKNLFVLKAFTKLYAMAGLRLGYGLCSDEALLERLQSVRQPWSVSGLAQRAGVKALEEQAYVKRTRDILSKEREWLSQSLKRLGLRVYPSQANYLFFQDCQEGHRPGDGRKQDRDRNPLTGRDRGWLYQELVRRKVLIRSCSNYPGLNASFYRICVKLREENEQLVQQMEQVLKGK